MKYSKIDIFFTTLLLIEVIAVLLVVFFDNSLLRAFLGVVAILGTVCNWKIFFQEVK